MTAMTGLPGQEPDQNCQSRAVRIGLPAQDCKDKTTKAEQKGEDGQKRTGIQGRQNRTARMGQAE
jgi:hypothetical protein